MGKLLVGFETFRVFRFRQTCLFMMRRHDRGNVFVFGTRFRWVVYVRMILWCEIVVWSFEEVYFSGFCRMWCIQRNVIEFSLWRYLCMFVLIWTKWYSMQMKVSIFGIFNESFWISKMVGKLLSSTPGNRSALHCSLVLIVQFACFVQISRFASASWFIWNYLKKKLTEIISHKSAYNDLLCKWKLSFVIHIDAEALNVFEIVFFSIVFMIYL